MAELDLRRDVDGWLEKQQRGTSGARTSIYCTSLARAHECLRRAVLEITHARLAKPFREETRRVLAAGKLAEETALSVLRECGLRLDRVSEQERLTDAADLFPVSGRIDWRLPDGRILEMKAVGEFTWGDLDAFLASGASLQYAPRAWWRAWWRQVQSYLWLANEPQAVMLFWRRDAVDARQCIVDADATVANELAFAAQTIRSQARLVTQEHIRTGDLMHNDVMDALPPHPPLDQEPPCADCMMRDVCNPAIRWKAISEFCEDNYLRECVATHNATAGAAKESEKSWKEAGARFHEYRKANAPDSAEWWLVYADGAMFGGKRAKDGSWRLRWRDPKVEAEPDAS